MKKNCLLFLTILLVFSFNIYIKADCLDEDLNEWATTAEIKFKMNTADPVGDYFYAYFLYITPRRDDVVIKVTDKDGNVSVGKSYDLLDIYGVGCYTNIYEETYTINIYGGEKSKCPNELLKTMTYTVAPYNDMITTEECVDHPEHELCQAFTNKTQNMTEEEFHKKMKEYENEIASGKFSLRKIFNIIKEYIVYILFPFFVISVIYIIKIKRFKKKEGLG